jgi:hypothetical protein
MRTRFLIGRRLPGFAVPVDCTLARVSDSPRHLAEACAVALRALGYEAPGGWDDDTIAELFEHLAELAPEGYRFGIRAECEDRVGFWSGEVVE